MSNIPEMTKIGTREPSDERPVKDSVLELAAAAKARSFGTLITVGHIVGSFEDREARRTGMLHGIDGQSEVVALGLSNDRREAALDYLRDRFPMASVRAYDLSLEVEPQLERDYRGARAAFFGEEPAPVKAIDRSAIQR